MLSKSISAAIENMQLAAWNRGVGSLLDRCAQPCGLRRTFLRRVLPPAAVNLLRIL